MSIKSLPLLDEMLDKDIDPPDDIWDDLRNDMSWLDDLANEYEEDEAAALHAFECRIYNETNRGLRT